MHKFCIQKHFKFINLLLIFTFLCNLTLFGCTTPTPQKYSKSEFYSRENLNESISGELILGLDEISRLYHWNNNWQIQEYQNKTIWKIRLFDRNDPLTNLYIYIDAINGAIIGAGSISD